MKQVVIIGGGAAGMTAAIAAARSGHEVTVLERGRKALKKLGVTGNGRGNLLNSGAPQYYGDEGFALEALRHMPFEQIAAFLRSCGISLAEEDEGRIYPSSFLASSAVDALNRTAYRLGVDCRTGVCATAIEKRADGLQVRAIRTRYSPDIILKSGRIKPGAEVDKEEICLPADQVIVAVGGAASPMHLTDGSAYPLLTALGHRLTELHPALCAILTDTEPITGLSGQRVRATLTLDGRHISRGEALFAEDGVSGIAAMQLSRFVREGSELVLDLRESVMGMDRHMDVEAWLRSRPGETGAELFSGAASPALAGALMRYARMQPVFPLEEKDYPALVQAITRFTLKVTGTRDFESAQVTAGGIAAEDFDPATMESRICPGVYAAGEVLDVDGACGGFNLMFAFASGLLAGGWRGAR